MMRSEGRGRAREWGMFLESGPTGPVNSITDVAGVRVGHFTLRDEAKGVATGVTAILPHGGELYRDRVPVGVHTINGYGKAIGFEQARELGLLETPILLTTTLCAGRAADALAGWVKRRVPDARSINPVVGECNDHRLNPGGLRVLERAHFEAALDSAAASPAGAAVEGGSVGAGTGMRGFGFKSGVGTASRVLESGRGGFRVGALVLLNCGRREDLMLCGVPVGRLLGERASGKSGARAGGDGREIRGDTGAASDGGSIVIVLATDAPADSRQLTRLARRATFGLARTGAWASHDSGDFAVAFSVHVAVPRDPEAVTRTVTVLNEDGPAMDGLFRAAVEATEEAIADALCSATALPGMDVPELPREETVAILRARGRAV
ncbi:MAG: P1 family peptidase [Planctomycetota bacterium]|nr:P1 family peptidase [Planctomycetota bacterium]